ncbi:MAG: hypothetical protein LAT68_09085 [Cyclobacteriaceae bacterium]|nr:hypothetical protein [Cyclobacteriaceae bacterium]MCH8516469.1 hypothetical protein [Cyclobacteriaceae bacterium]
MSNKNTGFDADRISQLKKEIEEGGKRYLLHSTEDHNDEYRTFYFVGMHQGKEVIFDAALFTLHLHYNSELYEVAEHRAANHFPDFHQISYEEDENGNLKALSDREEEIGLFMSEVMMELEEDEEMSVAEFCELDENLDDAIGIDCALNVDKITNEIITKFIQDFNQGTLNLDNTLYSFENDYFSEEE